MTFRVPAEYRDCTFNADTQEWTVHCPRGPVTVPAVVARRGMYDPFVVFQYISGEERRLYPQLPKPDLSAPGWDANGAPTP